MNQVERIGRFEVQERLRANSFAIVYRGRDPFDGRRVHIKFCVATDEAIRRRFLKAAERASTLRHPNVATVFEFGSGDSKPYLVQEVFSEESLSDLLARGEPIDDVFKLYYLVQIARGLQYAHDRDVLHRELRPASILIDRGGEAKIADFGTARLASASAQLGNGAHRWPAAGWLLPELLLGLDLDARSDIYAFGALAFEMMTGRAPFVADSLAVLVPKILETDPHPLGLLWPECPPELDRLVLRCLARDPGQRFESMDEVVEALDQIVPVSAPVDIYEEEKTVVIEDVQTIQVADLEPQIGPEKRTSADTVTLVRPADAVRARKANWTVVGKRLQIWGGQASRVADSGGRRVGQGLVKLRSVFSRKPAVRVDAARVRTAAIAIGSILLFGVVGWSVVRAPGPDPTPLPTLAPELPIDTIEIENGLLVVDTQPWGEVRRVVTGNGREVDLPPNPYTPLPLELEPGEYTIETFRPDLDQVETCVVVIESGAVTRCEPQLAALETDEFFKEIGWWQ